MSKTASTTIPQTMEQALKLSESLRIELGRLISEQKSIRARKKETYKRYKATLQRISWRLTAIRSQPIHRSLELINANMRVQLGDRYRRMPQ